MSAAVSDRDNGYKALVTRIFGLRRPKVTVGIHEAEGSAERKDDPALTVLEVALFHEYGLGVPERSFIRAWFDENQKPAREYIKRALESVIKGTRTKEQALELIGQKFVGQIQERISRGIEPPLSPETIKRKGSSVPLIDTGQLRSSITYKVEE